MSPTSRSRHATCGRIVTVRVAPVREQLRRGLCVDDDQGLASERRIVHDHGVEILVLDVFEHVDIDEEVEDCASFFGVLGDGPDRSGRARAG